MYVVQRNSSRISPIPSAGRLAYLSANSGSPRFIKTLVPVGANCSAATTAPSAAVACLIGLTIDSTLPL